MKQDFVTKDPVDLFYAALDCVIEGMHIDACIAQINLSLAFCLRLPQTSKEVNNTTQHHLFF